jgi:hypothetical protein
VGRRREQHEHEAREPRKAAIRGGAQAADEAPQARDFAQRPGDEPPLLSLSGGSLGAVDEPVGAGRGLLDRGGLVAVRAAARL